MIHQHQDSSTLIPSLLACLPNSLPLLCRLRNPQRSASSLILATFPPSPSSPYNGLFTAAYVDQSRHGESQAWFFCSLEMIDQVLLSTEELEKVKAQMGDMLRYINTCQPLGESCVREEGEVLSIASLHPLLVGAVQDICPAADVRLSREFIKYLFSSPPPPPSEDKVLQEGFEFGELTSENMDRVIATSSIRRNKETLLLLKNTAVFSVTGDKKVAIAWAFISFDGSLTTWWVENEWRGKGLGKAVAREILREMWEDESVEGGGGGDVAWGHADVAVDNWASRRGSVGLGGVEGWTVRWLWVDLKRVGKKYDGAGTEYPGGSGGGIQMGLQRSIRVGA